MKVLMLHGINHNMFGKRDPKQYGTITLAQIDEKLVALGKELGTERFWSLHLLNAPQGTFDDKSGSDLAECFERFKGH